MNPPIVRPSIEPTRLEDRAFSSFCSPTCSRIWTALLARLKLPMVSTTRAIDNGGRANSPGNHSGKVAMSMEDVALLVILAAPLQIWARVADLRISFRALANGL